MAERHDCPVCSRGAGVAFSRVDGYFYSRCATCGSIFIDPDVLDQIDAGESLVTYSESYWHEELPSARDRAYAQTLARMAEVMHYARIPVRAFLDVGTGPGYFLDAVSDYLPSHRDVFYGVEKFPPEEQFRTHSPNYLLGDVGSLDLKVDAGICMEVFEHLTPKTLRALIAELASVSLKRAIYIVNTGLPDYVASEDPGYLDPVRRGHIMSYSIEGLRYLAEGIGFEFYPLPGKTWAFLMEYQPTAADMAQTPLQRIWKPVEENMLLLSDPRMGSVLRILGLESARAYAW